MKVNLGSGENLMKGYINIDYRPVADLQKAIGVESLWPEIHGVTEAIISNSAEHFPNFLYWIADLARCCKDGCIWKVTVPYCTTTHHNIINPHHKNPWFSEHSFSFFGGLYIRESANDFRLEILKTEFTYNEKLWGKHSTEEWEDMRLKYLNVVESMYQEIKVIK